MPIVCWGALGKAANDPTTIDQEIQAYISTHNADLNAHGLSGYAIQVHRVDSPLDHIDYSVTSDKITADQIVGKDIRTAPNVGLTVDGVLMNPAGIQMYQNGQQKVNIPVTGNPTFTGKLSVSQIFFLNNYLASYFDTVDMIASVGGKVNLFGRPRPGQVIFSTYPNAGYVADFRIASSNLNNSISVFQEMGVLLVGTGSVNTYVGLGEFLTNLDADLGYGWAFINGHRYAVHRDNPGVAMYPIKNFDTSNPTILRVEVDNVDSEVRWLVDGNLYFSSNKMRAENPGGLLLNAMLYPFNNAAHHLYLRYVASGDLVD